MSIKYIAMNLYIIFTYIIFMVINLFNLILLKFSLFLIYFKLNIFHKKNSLINHFIIY